MTTIDKKRKGLPPVDGHLFGHNLFFYIQPSCPPSQLEESGYRSLDIGGGQMVTTNKKAWTPRQIGIHSREVTWIRCPFPVVQQPAPVVGDEHEVWSLDRGGGRSPESSPSRLSRGSFTRPPKIGAILCHALRCCPTAKRRSRPPPPRPCAPPASGTTDHRSGRLLPAAVWCSSQLPRPTPV